MTWQRNSVDAKCICFLPPLLSVLLLVCTPLFLASMYFSFLYTVVGQYKTLLLTGAGFSPLVIAQTDMGAHPFNSSVRQSYWKPWQPREIAPRCVSIFSQSLQERLRHGPCRTRRCYGWKRTARQRWTHTVDRDSTSAVGWAPASGRCFPVTLYHLWVCWALRRTTWVKVKTLLTFMVTAAHTRWIILHFHAVNSSLSEETVCLKSQSTSNLSSLMCKPEYEMQAAAFFCLKSFLFNQSCNSVCKQEEPSKLT